MRIADALPDKERKTLKELFKAALLASDSASSSSNALPNDMMLMLMLIQLENELDGIEEKLERNGRIVVRE